MGTVLYSSSKGQVQQLTGPLRIRVVTTYPQSSNFPGLHRCTTALSFPQHSPNVWESYWKWRSQERIQVLGLTRCSIHSRPAAPRLVHLRGMTSLDRLGVLFNVPIHRSSTEGFIFWIKSSLCPLIYCLQLLIIYTSSKVFLKIAKWSSRARK